MLLSYFKALNDKCFGVISLKEAVTTNDDKQHEERLCRCECCC